MVNDSTMVRLIKSFYESGCALNSENFLRNGRDCYSTQQLKSTAEGVCVPAYNFNKFSQHLSECYFCFNEFREYLPLRFKKRFNTNNNKNNIPKKRIGVKK